MLILRVYRNIGYTDANKILGLPDANDTQANSYSWPNFSESEWNIKEGELSNLLALDIAKKFNVTLESISSVVLRKCILGYEDIF